MVERDNPRAHFASAEDRDVFSDDYSSSFDYALIDHPIADDSTDVRHEPARSRSSSSLAASKSKPKKIKPGAQAAGRERPAFVGSSLAMQKLRSDIQIFGAENEPVLICGETGSGKEAVAQEIHRASTRNGSSFVVRNVSGITSELASSEFFGHVKGAFTGAVDKREGIFSLAHGGSLHLDEIGDLSLDIQSQILRVLEDGVVTPVGATSSVVVDTRIIAATNINLINAVKKNKFREDLYHRLNMLRIDVPPLRERSEDIVEISEYWLKKRGKTRERTAVLSKAAIKKLMDHHWPGNVRELKNVVIRGAVLARDGEISAEQIRLESGFACDGPDGFDVTKGRDLVSLFLAAKALDKAGGNATRAAEFTGQGRTSFMNIKKRLSQENANTAGLARDLRNFLGIC